MTMVDSSISFMSSLKIVLLLLVFSLVTICTAEWIDIDTPLDKRTTTSLVDGSVYHLVMSDEFNVNNRTFTDGHDPLWTALDKPDDDATSAGGGSLHFYNSSNVETVDGFLKISTLLGKTEWNRFDHVKKTWKHEVKNFTSGMIQTWDKFCFTGGIVEVDIVFPGDPYIGGLWPAVWMLGNLGRATYEASTSNIWPWSYNECNRSLQQAQKISACDAQNHFGMKPNVGRGATEIDIVEVMTGTKTGGLPGTSPSVDYPYCDLTLQVAPGVSNNRPQTGHAPLRKNILSANGHTQFFKDTWYDGLELAGNTSINPFFYGTFLAETKPDEPVSRTKEEAFQADAIGAAHQLTPSHFQKPHTFRLEWQPGRGGRLDWFVKNHKVSETQYMEGDGQGQEWVHAFSIKDKSLSDLMGSQIPIEPTYLILNVAVSSTWGFPYDTPDWCSKCYDCDDPKCACSFYPGFCQMLRSGQTSMYVDFVRVYQSSDPTAHVGANHTLGCDPPEYPTREWIYGHEYLYMRNPPFSYDDKHPQRKVQRGGALCNTDDDCGKSIETINLTAIYHGQQLPTEENTRQLPQEDGSTTTTIIGRGMCIQQPKQGLFGTVTNNKVCVCNDGFTGPRCRTLEHIDTAPSAQLLSMYKSPFTRISHFKMPVFMMGTLLAGVIMLVYILLQSVQQNQKFRASYSTSFVSRQVVVPPPSSATTIINGNVNSTKAEIHENVKLITGRSIR